MPELLTSPEAEPQRPGWLADQAVRGEPVSAIKNREKYREIRISGWKMAAGASPAPMFRAFLPLRTQKINREGDFAITGKCIAKNRESCHPTAIAWTTWTLHCLRGTTGNPHTNPGAVAAAHCR